MFKWIASIYLLLGVFLVEAHQPDISSTILIEQEDGSWILQVKSPMVAFEYEIESQYGDSAYSSAEEFRLLVIEYLKNNITINFNDEDKVTLGNGMVKLGHETNAIFQVLGIPKEIKSLAIRNGSFKNIHRNQNALIVVKKGISKKHLVLNNENQHTAHLKIEGLEFIEVKEDTDGNGFLYFFAILLFFLIGIMVFYRNSIKRNLGV